MAMEVNEPSYLATLQMSDVTMVIKQGMPGAKKEENKVWPNFFSSIQPWPDEINLISG